MELLENRGQEFHIFRCLYIFLWTISSGCAKYFVRLKGVGHQMNIFLLPFKFIQCLLYMVVRLPLHPATPHWKTHSMAVRAIPLSVCHHGPPSGYQTGFKRCSDAQYLFNYQCRWHKCKSGWSLKTEKIHLKWHVYIDTTHTYGINIWHELAHTLLHFLKLNSNICGTPLAFSLTFDLHYYLNCT